MNKTTTHIQVVDVSSYSYNTDNTIVRPPANLKVVRCTIYFQVLRGSFGTGYLTTVSNQDELNTLVFQNFMATATQVPPSTDVTVSGLNMLVLDRLGVGYMTENFYVSSDNNTGAQFVFIWEGITE